MFAANGVVDGWNTRRLTGAAVFAVLGLLIGYHAWRSARQIADADGKETGNGAVLIATICVIVIFGIAGDWAYTAYVNLNS